MPGVACDMGPQRVLLLLLSCFNLSSVVLVALPGSMCWDQADCMFKHAQGHYQSELFDSVLCVFCCRCYCTVSFEMHLSFLHQHLKPGYADVLMPFAYICMPYSRVLIAQLTVYFVHVSCSGDRPEQQNTSWPSAHCVALPSDSTFWQQWHLLPLCMVLCQHFTYQVVRPEVCVWQSASSKVV